MNIKRSGFHPAAQNGVLPLQAIVAVQRLVGRPIAIPRYPCCDPGCTSNASYFDLKKSGRVEP